MRIIIFLAIILLSATVNAQELIVGNPTVPIDTATHEIKYKEVVDVPGLTKEDIFSTARSWFPKDFQVAQAYISHADYKTGQIIAHAMVFGKRLVGLIGVPYSINFNIYLWIKDGKYKYEISDFFILWGLNGDATPDMHSADTYINDPQYKNKKGEYTGKARLILYNIDGNVQNVIVSLKYAILKKKYAHKVDDDF